MTFTIQYDTEPSRFLRKLDKHIAKRMPRARLQRGLGGVQDLPSSNNNHRKLFIYQVNAVEYGKHIMDWNYPVSLWIDSGSETRDSQTTFWMESKNGRCKSYTTKKFFNAVQNSWDHIYSNWGILDLS